MRKERVQPLFRRQSLHGLEYRFFLLPGELRIHGGF